MARVQVELPSLLCTVSGSDRIVEVEAETLRGALDELVRLRPQLGVHLFDETGGFRRHVLCFHNETNTRWLDDLHDPAADGDRVTILQAVFRG